MIVRPLFSLYKGGMPWYVVFFAPHRAERGSMRAPIHRPFVQLLGWNPARDKHR